MSKPDHARAAHAASVATKLRTAAHPVTTWPKDNSRTKMTPAERMIMAAEIHEKAARVAAS